MKPENIGVDELMQKLYGASLNSSDYSLAIDTLNELMEFVAGEEHYIASTASSKTETTDAPGWYQDVEGNLYKYDGVVWDVVPEKSAGKLEFLG